MVALHGTETFPTSPAVVLPFTHPNQPRVQSIDCYRFPYLRTPAWLLLLLLATLVDQRMECCHRRHKLRLRSHWEAAGGQGAEVWEGGFRMLKLGCRV